MNSPPQGNTLPGGIHQDAEADRRPKFYQTSVFLIVLVIASLIGVLWFGYGLQHGFLPPLPWSIKLKSPITTLVDAQPGVVLMLEQAGSASRVIIEKSSQPGWLLVSQDDTTVSGPSLAPNGRAVAYVTQQPESSLVVVSLVHTDPPTTVKGVDIQQAVSGFSICPWTPTAWDQKSQQVAFFACASPPSSSLVLVVKLSGSNLKMSKVIALSQSKRDTEAVRELRWLNEHQLTVSTPAGPGQSVASVDTIDVP